MSFSNLVWVPRRLTLLVCFTLADHMTRTQFQAGDTWRREFFLPSLHRFHPSNLSCSQRGTRPGEAFPNSESTHINRFCIF